MNKQEMVDRVVLMLGAEEQHKDTLEQMATCMTLTIMHALATGEEVHVEDFGTFTAHEGEVSFEPGDFCRHFVRTYKTAG